MSSDTTLRKAFADALMDMANPQKNAQNPHFRSSYANLESVLSVVKDALTPHGLGLRQYVDGGNMCAAVTDGTDELVLECRPFVPSGTMQQQGSMETYVRRYQLMTCFCLAPTEEDDGNAANQAEPAESVAKRVAWDYLQGKAAAYEAVFGEKPDVGKPSSIADCYRKAETLHQAVTEHAAG